MSVEISIDWWEATAMLANHSKMRIGFSIPYGAAAAGTLFLSGCTENLAPGVGAGFSADLEYVPPFGEAGTSDADRHAARFICGEIGPTEEQTTQVNDPLIGAVYRTLINLTNYDTGPACFDVAVIPTAIGDDLNTPPLTNMGCLQDDEAFNQGIEFDCSWIRDFLTDFNHPAADDDFLTGTLMVQINEPGTAIVSTTITALHKQVHGNWLPDLKPKSSCELVDGALQVTIFNQGEGQAPTTKTQIELSVGSPINLDTSPLDPGDSTLLAPVPFPDPVPEKVGVQITADADAAVEETDETNNELELVCLQPG